MTTREILEGARDIIRDPNRWCQKSPHDGNSHCAWGALTETEERAGVRCPSWEERNTPALLAVARQLPGGWEPNDPTSQLGAVAVFNDMHTHAEVLELFNLAIADEIRKEDTHSRHMAEEQERELAEAPAVPMVFA